MAPLSLSPEVATIEADFLKMREAFHNDVKSVRDLMANVEKDYGQKIGALQMRLDEITKGQKRGKANGAA